MKRILAILVVLFALLNAHAQIKDEISFSATIGYGIDFNTPTYNPVGLELGALYNFNSHIGLGVTTGIVRYEKYIIPICLTGQYRFARVGKFRLYVDAAAGYSISTCKDANGGFHATPSFGVSYPLNKKLHFRFAIGYQYQVLERLKKFDNSLFHAEFKEPLTHNSIGIKIGIIF